MSESLEQSIDKMLHTIHIFCMYDDVVFPTKRKEDGCYDIYAHFTEDMWEISPHTTVLIPTGIKSAFDDRYRIAFRDRGSNTKSMLWTQAGQIDSGYRGEWFVALYNGSHKMVVIDKSVDGYFLGMEKVIIPYSKAIAQFAIEDVPQIDIVRCNEMFISQSHSERKEGKLGDSGK